MKTVILSSILLTALITGCKKEESAPDNQQKIQAHPWQFNRSISIKGDQVRTETTTTLPCIGEIIWTFSPIDLEKKGYESCDIKTTENRTKPYSLISGQTQIRTFDNAGREDIYDILTLTADTLLLNSASQRSLQGGILHLEFIRRQ